MFAEKSVYQPATEDEGVRVLVMRTWPRGISLGRVDVWLKELGPLPELLRALEARRLSWPAFADAYLDQLATRPASIEALATVRELERSSSKVTLFCHEQLPPCHRFLLLDLLRVDAAMLKHDE